MKREFKNVWLVSGISKGDKLDGKTIIPQNNIAIVKENVSGQAHEIILPSKLKNIKVDDEKVRLYRGTNNAHLASGVAKSPSIQKIEFMGFEDPQEAKAPMTIIGYDGFDDTKSISFGKNETQTLVIDIQGDSLTLLGLATNRVSQSYTMTSEAESEPCDDSCGKAPCLDPVTRSVMELNDVPVGNGYTLGDIANIGMFASCGDEPTTEDVLKYELTRCDNGTEADLAEIQAQVNGIVTLKSRDLATSTYEAIATDGAKPSDFIPTKRSFVKDCADCPTGFTPTEKGYVYKITLEDEGVDESSVAESLANAIAGTGVKIGGNNGVGEYVVIVSKKPTKAEVNTFTDANTTATVDFRYYTSESLCVEDSTDPIAWEDGETCKVTEAKYRIVLKDQDCNGTRLDELKDAYPNAEIVELADPAPNKCRRMYEMTLKSNLVCKEECKPEMFTFETPGDYLGTRWYKVPVAANEELDCNCGIYIEPKLVEFFPPECLIGDLPSIKPDVEIMVSKEINSESGSLSSKESAYPLPITRVEGQAGTQYGEDFICMIRRQYQKESGYSAGSAADRLVNGQSLGINPGDQYTVARFRIASFDGNIGHSMVDVHYSSLQMVMLNSSPELREELKKINFSNNK